MISTSTAAICFIACHGGPADHFATFTQNLPKEVGAIEIYASGPALKKLQDRGIAAKSFSLDQISSNEEDVLAEKIAKTCSTTRVVMTDVGHPFAVKVQKALKCYAEKVTRLAYYDNPEPYVPGGYSSVAAEVMQLAQEILFANSNLSQAPLFQTPGKEIDLTGRKKVGIGYYPIDQAERILKRRSEEKSHLREVLFQKNEIIDKGQKVLVYFGGNNEEYFTKAFPAFLSLLGQGMMEANFTNLVIVLQQHPGAKAKNIDAKLVQEWIDCNQDKPQTVRIVVSENNSDDAQTVADGAFYYQTSMGPQFILAGIPTVQIGHETYADILVRNKLIPSVTTVGQLIKAVDQINQPNKEIPQEVILEGLGIKTNWVQNLEMALKT